MNKFFITRELVHYDSITKEKHTKKMYYMGIDNDYDSVTWISDKSKAKFFDDYKVATAVATELGAETVIEPGSRSAEDILYESLKN